MTRDARARSLVALAWIATTLTGAWLLAPLLAPSLPGSPLGAAPLSPPPAAAAAAGAEHAATSGATLAMTPGVQPPEPSPPSSPTPLPESPAGAAPPAGAEAPAGPTGSAPATRLLIRVVDAKGQVVTDGTVYALPAGARGGDDETVFHAAVADEGETELVMPAARALDVGFDSGGLSALLRDVVPTPGADTRVALTVPAGLPVRFEAAEPIAPDSGAVATVTVSLQTEGPSEQFAGRDQTAYVSLRGALAQDGTLELGPALPGSTFRVRVDTRWRRGKANVEGPWWLVPDAPFATAGQKVRLRRVVPGKLVLRPRQDGVVTRQGRVTLQVRDADGRSVFNQQHQWRPGQASSPNLFDQTPSVAVLAGTYRVSWFGQNVEAGQADPVEIVDGATREVAVPVRFLEGVRTRQPIEVVAGPTRAGPVTLTVRVAWPDGAPAPERPGVRLGVIPAVGSGLDAVDEGLEGDPMRIELPAPLWESRPPAVVSAGAWLASRPLVLGGPTTVEVSLEPAGLLLVCLETPTNDAPMATLTRVDGLPLIVEPHSGVDNLEGEAAKDLGQNWSPDDILVEARVRMGSVLGPLPAGTYRFRVRRGGFDLGEVTATVVAGGVRPLVVPR